MHDGNVDFRKEGRGKDHWGGLRVSFVGRAVGCRYALVDRLNQKQVPINFKVCVV